MSIERKLNVDYYGQRDFEAQVGLYQCHKEMVGRQ